MELVEGQPLSVAVKPEGLPTETVLRYGLQISTALAHAHERGVIHRDLKTANVVITANGHVKVLDFGLAKRLSGEELADVTRSQDTLTEAGRIVGTPAYMAPETLRGEPADARTDIWALGAVLYEMASGAPPFHGRAQYELIQAILWEPPRPLPPRVPQGLRAITQRCLSKEPTQRYQHAAEVRAALEAIEPHSVPTARVSPLLPRPRPKWLPVTIALGTIVLLVAAGYAGYTLLRPKSLAPARSAVAQTDWVQLTDFADSAVSPELSPDGRMLAFIRGNSTFFGPSQINVMLLPSGEPVRLTNDGLPKMSPQFSPDGSTIAYTVPWDTWMVPVLGGEPRRILPNAEGLTWIDPEHILFSEIKTGIHMAVVTATQSRTDSRDVYIPPRERGMAHRSALSPDRKWMLLSEMDNGGWLPCRVVPFDGSSRGKAIGPPRAGCTYVSWSPDGNWMYFNSDAGGRFHLWRQRFPDGQPQQLTSGATEEEGIALAPDGRSLITSSGLQDSTLWVRDARGERQVSSEGFAQYPQFSADGKKLYYLVRRHGVSGSFSEGELWVADLTMDRVERLLPGFVVNGYAISPDTKSVAFSAIDKGHSYLWVASLDLRSSPRQFPSPVDEDQPYWDSAGQLYFRATEGKLNFLYRMNADGSDRAKAVADPILSLESVSPDGKWAVVTQPAEGDPSIREVALPIAGGAPVTICRGYCVPVWNTTATVFSVMPDAFAGGKTVQVPVSPGRFLPELPANGLATVADMAQIKGAKILDGAVIAGPTRDLSASLHRTVRRNLYRIPLQ
jgi:serine/threonine protein kinase